MIDAFWCLITRQGWREQGTLEFKHSKILVLSGDLTLDTVQQKVLAQILKKTLKDLKLNVRLPKQWEGGEGWQKKRKENICQSNAGWGKSTRKA